MAHGTRMYTETLTHVGFNSWYWLHCHWSLRVSSTKIKNLRWQLSGAIIQVTFGKSSTSLVQQLKKKLVHKNCATGYWLPLSLFNFFLMFLDQRCWRFSEGYPNNFSTGLLSQIFDCCPRNFLIQEERIGNVVSTTNWITPVIKKILVYCHNGNSVEMFYSRHTFFCKTIMASCRAL